MTREEWIAICEQDAEWQEREPAYAGADRRELVKAVKELTRVLIEIQEYARSELREPPEAVEAWLELVTTKALAPFEEEVNPKLAAILGLIETRSGHKHDRSNSDSIEALSAAYARADIDRCTLLRIVKAQQEVIEHYEQHAHSLSHITELKLDALLEELSK